jgi:hypothetical protein
MSIRSPALPCPNEEICDVNAYRTTVALTQLHSAKKENRDQREEEGGRMRS